MFQGSLYHAIRSRMRMVLIQNIVGQRTRINSYADWNPFRFSLFNNGYYIIYAPNIAWVNT